MFFSAYFWFSIHLFILFSYSFWRILTLTVSSINEGFGWIISDIWTVLSTQDFLRVYTHINGISPVWHGFCITKITPVTSEPLILHLLPYPFIQKFQTVWTDKYVAGHKVPPESSLLSLGVCALKALSFHTTLAEGLAFELLVTSQIRFSLTTDKWFHLWIWKQSESVRRCTYIFLHSDAQTPNLTSGSHCGGGGFKLMWWRRTLWVSALSLLIIY